MPEFFVLESVESNSPSPACATVPAAHCRNLPVDLGPFDTAAHVRRLIARIRPCRDRPSKT
ncbi:hypothetical protein GCM10012280_40250 [Wenjunlia tyrosinilytica]|uniref:Uncharacterized protein n=1 Tax=Wenjunlia tyrosinilytica TaxID=1544741 RepID=A0A917ZV36_9ACTN|nr:hypothetical protein GCM10012280_40250 [Wenjunlia tyrosinilytica]